MDAASAGTDWMFSLARHPMRRPRPWRPFAIVALTTMLAPWMHGGANAQVVERNLPPETVAPPQPKLDAQPTPSDQDDRPIGPALKAIVALGPTDAVRSGGASGVDFAASLRLRKSQDRAALSRFLGRPISRKLIGDVQTAITRFYRAQGRPFVSITTPEQEITSGVLQLRIIEFSAGRVQATGGKRTPHGYVEDRVRAVAGGPIDAGDLSEDLDWLNRNPFRQVQPVFAPGQGLGRTNVDLTITEQRPFRVYGGYAQSGSQATGRDRYSLGGQIAGLPGLPDALSSYQFTGSYDAIGDAHPKYVSHAVRLSAPVWPRQALELSFDRVESNAPARDFASRSLTQEATLGYRGALSNLSPASLGLRGDITLGVEARQSDQQLLFGGAVARRTDTEVFQLYLGYIGGSLDRFGATSLNATLHVSPGGLGSRDTDVAYRAFSTDRTRSAQYAYVNAQVSRSTPLPGGFALATEVIAQYAGDALPATEQAAIGGPSLVRGYSLDDGAFDTGVVVRSELRGPSVRLAPISRSIGDALQPRLFFDAGWAYERGLSRAMTALSAGLGADYQLSSHFQFGGDLACPFRHGPYTRSDVCRVESRLTLGY